MIHERFKTYFRETFFVGKDEEFENFIASLEVGIPRTIRIKPGKIEEVRARLERDGWILESTGIYNVFSLDRTADFDPLERRIGYSIDHLVGNFYIQELAAAHPVDVLADGKVQDERYLILDMASSPGGKTTQLAEYYPNSFIVANEPTRERIPQLLQNLDRMGSANIGVTLYPGQYWKGFHEVFDRILLDAPCSGEGTLYKGTDATKHWHIKNIKNIAKLQEKLLDASLHALKVGGEMIYSTCSLNHLEDEGVIVSMMKKYPGKFEILFQKKFWPHIDKTGGFFVTKLRKIAPIEHKVFEDKVYNSNVKLKKWGKKLQDWELSQQGELYEHDGKVLFTRNSELAEELREKVYFMRWGDYLGEDLGGGKILPGSMTHRYLKTKELEKFTLQNDEEVDIYLRGSKQESIGKDTWGVIESMDLQLSLEYRKDNIINNRFPLDWQRK